MTGPDVPEKDRLAEAVVWDLCEGTTFPSSHTDKAQIVEIDIAGR